MDPPPLPNFKLLKPTKALVTTGGDFITAKEKLLNDIEMQERIIDGQKFLIEAKMGLWYVNDDASHWQNKHKAQEWHFKDHGLKKYK